MAILLAFQSPELDVIGLTSTFGNVHTALATRNALHLCEVAGKDVPVAQGLLTTLRGAVNLGIADFVHGSDGLGHTNPPEPKQKPIDLSGPEFLVARVEEFPGEVTVVALGPLTNIAKALELDRDFPKKVREIFVLGGAFFVNGNINPAAEANIAGDPEAADIVLTCGANITVIGINITHQVMMTGREIEELGKCNSKFGKYLRNALQFYYDYHHEFYGVDAIYLHDPTTMVAAIDPSLLTYAEGVVRVQQEGICKGLTLFNSTKKKWAEPTEWCNKPPIKVAVTVDSDAVANLIKARLMAL
ncbi:hypothetical protein O6H91_16G046200 [Diphasiastrum complanatum]|nr:hypothetical protein O6H91_16G046200 [Diphasiastrum complanatum]